MLHSLSHPLSMIPVDQTRFAGDHPNCLAACLATIFEVPIEEIDSPALASGGTQWAALMEVCHAHGYHPFSYSPSPEDGGPFPPIAPPGYHIACSETHATVAYNGEIVHDPHPRRSGVKVVTEWILLLPVAAENHLVVSPFMQAIAAGVLCLP